MVDSLTRVSTMTQQSAPCEQCSAPDARLTIHGQLCATCSARVANAVPKHDDTARVIARTLDTQETTWNR